MPDKSADEDRTATESTRETDWTAAATQVRSSAAWIVKSFAAIAVALVGTSPLLVNLGNLALDARSVVAVVGATAALAAIAVIIGAATDINLTQVTDIVDLTQPDGATAAVINRIQGSAAAKDLYLAGTDSVQQVLDLRRTYERLHGQQLTLLAGMTNEADRATTKAIADATSDSLKNIDAAISNLQGWVTYQRIRRRFDARRPKMFAAGAVAILGTAVWLTALGIDISGSDSKDVSQPVGGTVATTQGSVGTLEWSTDGSGQAAASSLRKQLGLGARACAKATVLVSGGSGDPIDPWQVSLLPHQRCKPTSALGTFSVDRRLATFTGLRPEAGPSATVTIESGGSSVGATGWVVIVVSVAVVAGAGGGYLARRRMFADPSTRVVGR